MLMQDDMCMEVSIMTKFRTLTASLNQMADGTYRILRATLFLACTVAACALILFFASGGRTIGGFEAYMVAQELLGFLSAMLLVGMIAALLVEGCTREHN